MGANANSPSGVAVVIPTYNCAPYLPRALDSVLGQTYRDCSFFAIDDGSTDDTVSVIRCYLERGIYLRQEQSGPAAARNCGIRASNSSYLAFLDADDFWLPTKLERQIELLERHPEIGLVCSNFSISGGLAPAASYFSRVRLPADGHMFAHLLRDCPVCTSTVVVRRQCLVDVGLFNESLSVAEDLNLWLRIASRWDVAIIPEVLVTKHVRNENLSTTTAIERKLSNGIAALEHVMSSCAGISSQEQCQVERVLADRYYDYGSYLLAARARQSARREFAAALRLWPMHWRATAKLGGTFLPASSFEFLVRLLRGRNSVGLI